MCNGEVFFIEGVLYRVVHYTSLMVLHVQCTCKYYRPGQVMPAAPNKITTNGDRIYHGAQTQLYERVRATIELLVSDY